MKVASGLVEGVKVREAQGQHGPFFNINFKVGDLWLSQSSPKEDLIKPGDTVEAVYDTKAGNGGVVFNNVIKGGLKVTRGSGNSESSQSSTQSSSTKQAPLVKLSSNAGSEDKRQALIAYQNALAHATKLTIYNAGLSSSEAKLEDVLTLAKKIQKATLSSDLSLTDLTQSNTIEVRERGTPLDDLE